MLEKLGLHRFAYDYRAEHIPTWDAELDALASRHSARLVGPSRDGNWAPHARGVRRMEAALIASGPVNLAEWEPTYGRLAEAQVKLEAAQR